MGRLEEQLFRIGERLAELTSEERLMSEELTYHRHLNDDATRDAAVSGMPAEAAEARQTEADVARFERELVKLARERAKLETKRAKLMDRL